MKRRLLILAVFFALFMTFVGLSKPAIVQAVCPIKGTICNPPVSSGGGGGPGILFNDGRINNNDPWETSAIYCLGDGSVRVYVLGNPWHIAFTASPQAIINSRIMFPGQTNAILIGLNMGARLYRLPNGMLQVTSPGLNPSDGDYSVIFLECPGLPAAASSLAVEVDGTRVADIISVSGLDNQNGIYYYFQHTSGHHEISTSQNSGSITITKVISADQLFSNWRKSYLDGKFDRKTVSIVFLNGDGKEIRRITLYNCYPVKWALSGSLKSVPPVETVQLVCERAEAK